MSVMIACLNSWPHLQVRSTGRSFTAGSDGRSIFNDLLFRRKKLAYFYAFDLLWLNGKDLRQKPLYERKAKLRWLISDSMSPLLYSQHVEGTGIELFNEICKHDMEGIVAKHRDGIYVADARQMAIRREFALMFETCLGLSKQS